MNKYLVLDVSELMDEKTFHEYISKKLHFSEYYGFNMDALWDCITDPDQSAMPKMLIVEGLASLNNSLPVLHNTFVKRLVDYDNLYPDREIILPQDSPSGGGIELEED